MPISMRSYTNSRTDISGRTCHQKIVHGKYSADVRIKNDQIEILQVEQEGTDGVFHALPKEDWPSAIAELLFLSVNGVDSFEKFFSKTKTEHDCHRGALFI